MRHPLGKKRQFHTPAKAKKEIPSQSIAQFLGFLPLAGTMLALLGVVGSFAGLLTMQSYYRELGAAWYSSSLPTARFIQEGAPVLLFCTMAIFLTAMCARQQVATRIMSAWAAYVGISGMLLAFIACDAARFILPLVESWSDPRSKLICSMIASIMMMISAGITIGILISRMTSDNFQIWKVSGIGLVYIFAFGLATFAVGTNHAKFDRDQKPSPLSKIALKDSTDDWRLVDISGDTALIVRIATKPEDVTFRLLKLHEGHEIKHSGGLPLVY